MIREFGNDANAASTETGIVREEETPRGEPTTLGSFHTQEDEGESSNTVKIAAGTLIGLLVIGGGLYAYEASKAPTLPPHVVAMKPPPKNTAMATPALTPTSQATTPSDVLPSPPTPATSSAPAPTPLKQARVSTPKDATIHQQDAAINQPMTLTPQTAPPAQQSMAANPADRTQQPDVSQTANNQADTQSTAQQAITAPVVAGQSTGPTPEVANNTSSGVSVPADTQPQATSQPAQTPAVTSPEVASPQPQSPSTQGQ